MSYNSIIVPNDSDMIDTWEGIKIPIKVELWVDNLSKYHISFNSWEMFKYGISPSDKELGHVNTHPFIGFKKHMFPKEDNKGISSCIVDAFLLTYENPFHGSYPCVCCRLPWIYKGVCNNCKISIQSIILKDYDTSICLKKEQWDERYRRSKVFNDWLCKEANKGKKNTFISSWKEVDEHSIKHVKDDRNMGYFPKSQTYWPGFYLGNYKWDRMEQLLELCIFPFIDEDGIVHIKL